MDVAKFNDLAIAKRAASERVTAARAAYERASDECRVAMSEDRKASEAFFEFVTKEAATACDGFSASDRSDNAAHRILPDPIWLFDPRTL